MVAKRTSKGRIAELLFDHVADHALGLGSQNIERIGFVRFIGGTLKRQEADLWPLPCVITSSLPGWILDYLLNVRYGPFSHMKRPTLLLRDDKVVNVFYPGVPTGYKCRWDGGMV